MRNIHFTVDRLEYVGRGKFMVGGRNCLDELRKGDALRLAKGAKECDRDWIVEEITMYGKEVEAVSPGMTAALFFSNEHARYFCLGAELKGELT